MRTYWDNALEDFMKKVGAGDLNVAKELYDMKKEPEHLAQALHFSVAMANQAVVNKIIHWRYFPIWEETRELSKKNNINVSRSYESL
jgi:fructose-1-phosphate kinase PfkB-like protein